METVEIIEVSIDFEGKLILKPICNPSKMFRFVYRAAMEVGWDEELKSFFTPQPKTWSYLDWYIQSLNAVFSEMGIRLHVNDKTSWTNVPKEVRDQIEGHVYE